VETAVEILDREGPKGLTLRGLATELGGGLGSVYWYVDGKDELISLAGDALVGEALARAAATASGGSDATAAASADRTDPALLETSDPVVAAAVEQLRRTALALFEQTQLHPWLALQLQAQAASSPNALRFWERLGRPLAAMGLSRRQQFHGSTAISGYVQGVAAEMAAQDLVADQNRPKDEQLDEIVSGWLANDPSEFSWIHSIADEFREHDDRDQFAAGLDLLLGGLVRQAVEHSGPTGQPERTERTEPTAQTGQTEKAGRTSG
jgi:AcrR family transcriptional regulator